MYRGQIPGHYYDAEKNKYFKILPNHTGSRYSSGSVTAIEKQKHKSRIQSEQNKAIRQQLIRRNPVLSAPLAAGAFLSRELAQHDSPANTHETWTQAYGSGLKQHWERSFHQNVSAFAYDPATGDFLVGSRCPSGHANLSAFPYSTLDDKNEHQSKIIEAFGCSDISSISLSPSRVAALTGMGGPRAMITFMSLADVEHSTSPRGSEIDCDMSVSFMFSSETTAWAAAANPFIHDQSMFVVGMSDGAIQFTDADGGWEDVECEQTHSDIMAVEWLTPTVVSLGQRNGSIKLWDIRSSGSALRLQHPARVTGLKRVDNHSLISCGLESSLAMYDLRMPIGADTQLPAPKRRHKAKSRTTSKESTTPVLRFDYQNEGHRPLGFDVDCDRSLLAAANDRNGIDLFSISTGKKIETQEPLHHNRPGQSQLPRAAHDDGVSNLFYNLQFCQKPETDSLPSESFLFGSTLTDLFSFGWQSRTAT